MKKIYPLEKDENKFVYKCESTDIDGYQIIIIHKFPEVDLLTEKISYYVTVNEDKIFLNENDTDAIYYPELMITSMENNLSYKSIYNIPTLEKLFKYKNDEVRINLILPFDCDSNIYKVIFKFLD